MPDISMCKNNTCPLKSRCYRFMATPSEYYQSYSSFKPDEDGSCMYHMPIVPSPRQLAIEWWDSMSSAQKTRLCDLNTDVLVGSPRRWESLTGREIEVVYKRNQNHTS